MSSVPQLEPAPDPATFGTRLKAAREAAKLTQAELAIGMGANGCDLGKAAISAWETGRGKPDTDQLAIVCERLSVSADWLLGRAANDSEKARA